MPSRRTLTALTATLCAACLGLSLAACAASGGASAMAFTQADDQHDVRVAVGRDFTVRLPSNLSTGYSWKLDPIDAALVELVEKTDVPPADPKPGSPGEVLFHFRAKAAGAAPISLRLVRPWEASAAPAKTFRVNLTIE